MGLFSRRKPRQAEEAVGGESPGQRDRAEELDRREADRPDAADGPGSADGPDADTGMETSEEPAPEEDGTAATPRGDHLEDGPYDVSEAPEEDRIDLGGLQVPTVDGMELRMEVDQRSGAVTGANLVLGGSSLQVQAFAAPKSRGLWEDVRSSLRDSVVSQGGTAETRPGAFGPELITRLPVKRADGRTGYRPARFLGVDGRRWFLRAILTGPALGDPEQARRFETLVSRLVVVRGTGAMAPQELIPLHLPGERPGLEQVRSGPLDPLARGPEITEIG